MCNFFWLTYSQLECSSITFFAFKCLIWIICSVGTSFTFFKLSFYWIWFNYSLIVSLLWCGSLTLQTVFQSPVNGRCTSCFNYGLKRCWDGLWQDIDMVIHNLLSFACAVVYFRLPLPIIMRGLLNLSIMSHLLFVGAFLLLSVFFLITFNHSATNCFPFHDYSSLLAINCELKRDSNCFRFSVVISNILPIISYFLGIKWNLFKFLHFLIFLLLGRYCMGTKFRIN